MLGSGQAVIFVHHRFSAIAIVAIMTDFVTYISVQLMENRGRKSCPIPIRYKIDRCGQGWKDASRSCHANY